MILFHCYFSNIIIDIIITIFFIFIVITNIVLSHLSCLNFIFSFFLFLCSLMEIGTFWSFFILFLSSVIQYLVVSILYYRNQCTVIMAFRLFNIVMCVYFYWWQMKYVYPIHTYLKFSCFRRHNVVAFNFIKIT